MPENTIDLINEKNNRVQKFPVGTETTMPYSNYSTEGKAVVTLENKFGIKGRLIRRYVSMYPQMYGFKEIRNWSRADTYLNAWKELKKRGLEVVPNMRKVDDNYVAVTDVSANGSVVFDIKIDLNMERKQSELDKVFLDIKRADLEAKRDEIVETANKTGIHIPYDAAPQIVISKDGSWKPIFLDISNAEIFKNPRDLTAKFKTHNFDIMDDWVVGVVETQEKIKSESQNIV